jgi:hypothetical protein
MIHIFKVLSGDIATRNFKIDVIWRAIKVTGLFMSLIKSTVPSSELKLFQVSMKEATSHIQWIFSYQVEIRCSKARLLPAKARSS